MNIKEAKNQIKNALTAYFTKDEFGSYMIPVEKQRPVFLMGAPGIGKTAVMEQIASEMGIGLLSYSMTHHTRQSALGLPFIVHKNYEGFECDVSEYTMSEIIASVYDLIENTGVKEGILFLDEINCVSETLAPVMLQFLQYKVFGRHSVPEGWIVVTAGNPPEFNNSVREFDIATWDRLKRIDVEPDFEVWKEYAYGAGIHPAVLTYLEIKTSDFYSIESTVDGKSFITARGWEDLSQMIILYEKNSIKVDEKLISQYIQNRKISKNFAVYYDLFNKYRSDYQIDDILSGKASDDIKERASKAKFDERLSLLGLIIDGCSAAVCPAAEKESISTELMTVLRDFKKLTSRPGSKPAEVMSGFITEKTDEVKKGLKSCSLSADTRRKKQLIIRYMEKWQDIIAGKNNTESFRLLMKEYEAFTKEMKTQADTAGKKLSAAFSFCEDCFKEGQEILIFVTELTANINTAKFISRFGCDDYFRHNKELLFYDRQKEIMSQIKELEDYIPAD